MNNNGACNNIDVIVFERLWFKNYFRNVCLFVFFLKNSFSKMNKFNKKEQSQKFLFFSKVSFLICLKYLSLEEDGWLEQTTDKQNPVGPPNFNRILNLSS